MWEVLPNCCREGQGCPLGFSLLSCHMYAGPYSGMRLPESQHILLGVMGPTLTLRYLAKSGTGMDLGVEMNVKVSYSKQGMHSVTHTSVRKAQSQVIGRLPPGITTLK